MVQFWNSLPFGDPSSKSSPEHFAEILQKHSDYGWMLVTDWGELSWDEGEGEVICT